ncbi:DUF2169 family type VI secretion system accessory protein [Gilvimarinus japonicus]|uniref:DUF2169 domain-containing protein n=1 Tax=Gilvimarinus japonicus TaxID=1796469 RepID=A0ABV7HN24_9GAMM
MQLTNLTPFSALCFSSVDTLDRACDTVVIRVGYHITIDPASGVASLTVRDTDAEPLQLEDSYWGPVAAHANDPTTPRPDEDKPFYEHNLRQETDLAPFKPCCDLLVVGSAHAPQGKPAKRWPIKLRLQSRTQNSPSITVPVIEKVLEVSPPGAFYHGVLGWTLKRDKKALKVPLRWEYAFGGKSQVPNPKHLTDATLPEWLLNEVCYSNPLGGGWMDKRHARLARKANTALPKMLTAPSIFYPKQSLQEPVRIKHPKDVTTARKMAEVAAGYPLQPAGLGVVNRSWAPRLALSGTYDERWQKTRWPLPPKDFDERYWNCAPLDQQAPWPSPDCTLEAWHLFDPAVAPTGYVAMQLPGHRAFVMARLNNGTPLPLPAVIDTLVLDTDQQTLSVVWRCRIPKNPLIASLETRFEVDPSAPLLKWRPHLQGQETSAIQTTRKEATT